LQAARLAAVAGLGAVSEPKRMDTFYIALMVVATTCPFIIAIVAYALVKDSGRNTGRFKITKVKGFVKDDRLVDIHLSSGQVYRGVRFVGCCNQRVPESGISLRLSRFVVCETQQGARVFIPPEAISMIEELKADRVA
jgi:hypothetical protein